MFTFDPIGYFQSSAHSPYELPRQAGLVPANQGIIQLNERCQFEQALEGLEGFDLIWVVFRLHRSALWKPKVLPPRGRKKQGVFATRSPHRPNFIGMSCVKLESIHGLSLMISGHDLLDGTPILDIKPYLNYADSLVSTRQGWLEVFLRDRKLRSNGHCLQTLSSIICLKFGIVRSRRQLSIAFPNHRARIPIIV